MRRLDDGYFPTYEEVVGTPEEIIRDGQDVRFLPPLQHLQARCLRCFAIHVVAKFRFRDEVVSLPNGDTTTADDWWEESWRANHFRGRRFKFECSRCEQVTHHLAIRKDI